MRIRTFILLLAVIIIVAGVWYSHSLQQPQPAAQTQTPPSTTLTTPTTTTSTQPQGDGSSPAQNLTLGTDGNAELGTYLIGYNGMTLYTYARDQVGTSTCYEQCAQTWPPYTVSLGTKLNLQYGVTGQGGTIVRADGNTQVTYRGLPLYFYAGDKTSSDYKGQGLGGVWYVAKP